MKLFGLTGGVGMGKSTCAAFLRERGMPVIDTDLLARELVQPGLPALAEMTDAFGRSILDESGRLRRDVLADIVFEDAGARRKLESILHPKIQERWLAQAAQWRNEGRVAATVAIPLLFETGSETRVDATVCVACTAGTQHARLSARGWTEREIVRRAAAQLPVDQKIARANYVIWTEGSLEAHAEQAARIFGLD